MPNGWGFNWNESSIEDTTPVIPDVSGSETTEGENFLDDLGDVIDIFGDVVDIFEDMGLFGGNGDKGEDDTKRDTTKEGDNAIIDWFQRNFGTGIAGMTFDKLIPVVVVGFVGLGLVILVTRK